MLDANELKVVLTTLSKRRAWLLKSLEEQNLEAGVREEYQATLKLLDSSVQKLARTATSAGKTNPPKPQAPIKPAAPPPAPRRVSKRQAVEMADAYVLIAEDNHDSAQLLRGVLEDMGISRIDLVADGRAALYALQNCSPPYDLVLCDWDMPEMSGIDVHRSVKSLAKLRDTHFVMVTAISAAGRIREAIQQGVSDYLVKPIDIDVLEKKIKAALAGGEPPKEKQELLQVKNKQPEDNGAASDPRG